MTSKVKQGNSGLRIFFTNYVLYVISVLPHGKKLNNIQ